MNRIAQFEKISFDEFKKSCIELFKDLKGIDDTQLKYIYDQIELPTRSTKGSMGYDFKSVCFFQINPGQTVKIPTGIKVSIDEGWGLVIVPRSSYGFKYRAQLDNTIGIIDSDYYNNKNNEGHIIVKMTNDSNYKDNTLICNPGDNFVQGIFLPYGITKDDNADGVRTGGFGSTDAK